MNSKHIFLSTLVGPLVIPSLNAAETNRPNILFVISDDQSYPHASAYGSPIAKTPAFDFVARNGWLFNNAFVTSPGSSPSRASILTGLYPWQIAEAGTHASSFPAKYKCFPDILAEAGYHVGCTGKGWGPGDWKISGRSITLQVRNTIKDTFNLLSKECPIPIIIKTLKNFSTPERRNSLSISGSVHCLLYTSDAADEL
mgnify:CR=1 FL=1